MTTTTTQREACFYSGLGKTAGLFIYDRLDVFVDSLASFQQAVASGDANAAAEAAVAFATMAMEERQFSIEKTA